MCGDDIFYTLVLDSGGQGVHSKEFPIPSAPFNFPPHTRVVCEAIYFDAITSTQGAGTFNDSLFIRASAPQPYSMDTRTNNGLTNIIAVAEPTTFLEGVTVGQSNLTSLYKEYKLRQDKWKTILASPFGGTLTITLADRNNAHTSENWTQWTCMLRLTPLKEDASVPRANPMQM